MLFATSKQAAQKRYGAGEPGAWPGRWAVLAPRVLDGTVQQAQDLYHDYARTAHVLLAPMAHDRDAGQVLRDLRVVRDRVLAEQSGSCTQGRSGRHTVMPRLK